MLRRLLPVIMVAGLAGIPATLVSPASVQAEEKKAELHIRGSVVDFAGSNLKVKTREGETVDVALADGWQVASVANAKVLQHRALRLAAQINEKGEP